MEQHPDQDPLAIVEHALDMLDVAMSTPECQGQLAGWLCANSKLSCDEWLQHLVPGQDPADLLQQEAMTILKGLYRAVLDQLNDSMMDFRLLLPADSTTLDERVDALAEWCQGFVMGMMRGGIREVSGLPGEAGEAVRDLLEIARAGGYSTESGEEDEVAYNELLEYVRTVVLLINEDLNSHHRTTPIDTDSTMH